MNQYHFWGSVEGIMILTSFVFYSFALHLFHIFYTPFWDIALTKYTLPIFLLLLLFLQ